MMKTISVLLAAVLLLAHPAFGDTESDIMSQYDFSSPEASFQSLQTAIHNKDFYGTNIHFWNILKASPEARPEVQNKSMEEAFSTMWPGLADSPEFFDNETIMLVSRLVSDPNSRDHNSPVTNLKFVRGLDRETDDNGIETCRVEVEDVRDGSHGYITAFRDKAGNWWIATIIGD